MRIFTLLISQAEIINQYKNKFKYVLKKLTNNLFLVVNGNLPKKILGGNIVTIEKNPWQVSVQFQKQHICGGTIISGELVLTSASCVTSETDVIYGNIEVLSGTNDLTKNPEDIYWRIHEVAFVIVHENYTPRLNWMNDIGNRNL